MYLEQEVAEKAFAKALKRPDPHPTESVRELTEMLNENYRELGLSAGIQQTRQLVRDIERSAAAQAANFRGRRPG